MLWQKKERLLLYLKRVTRIHTILEQIFINFVRDMQLLLLTLILLHITYLIYVLWSCVVQNKDKHGGFNVLQVFHVVNAQGFQPVTILKRIFRQVIQCKL